MIRKVGPAVAAGKEAAMSKIPSIANLNPLLDVMELIYGVYPSMTVQQIRVLLLIAANPGISQKEIMGAMGDIADSSVSRIVGILGAYGSRGTKPMNLVEVRIHPTNRQSKALHLTKTGEELVRKLLRALKSA